MSVGSVNEMNSTISRGMWNIYLKSSYWEQLLLSKPRFSKFRKCLQVSFWQAPTHADITEFSSFLLQL